MRLLEKIILPLLTLLIVNIAVFAAAHMKFIGWGAAYFTIWLECAIIALLALSIYAKHLVVFFLLLAFLGYVSGAKEVFLWENSRIPIAFWSLYSLFWLVYFEIRKSALGQRLRLSYPIYQLLFYLCYLTLAAGGSIALTSALYYGRIIIPSLPENISRLMAALILLVPTLTIIILKAVDMIGAKHFLVFLFGAYHRPVERKLIIVFLDMIGSTALAEKRSPKEGMELVARFIFDATLAFRVFGGDIVNYTGDGLVALWPVDRADKTIEALRYLSKRLESGRAAYERKFGVVPDFRAGIHAGDVVLAQIGEEKLFLGVYGDAVNTAARIEQMNKELGTKILFSKALRQRLSLPLQRYAAPVGKLEIKGREGQLEIYALSDRLVPARESGRQHIEK